MKFLVLSVLLFFSLTCLASAQQREGDLFDKLGIDLSPGSTDETHTQQQTTGYSPALAKCILNNLDKAHSDTAAKLLVAACRSLNR